MQKYFRSDYLLTQTFWRAVEMGGDKLEWVTLNAPQRRRFDFYKSPGLFYQKVFWWD